MQITSVPEITIRLRTDLDRPKLSQGFTRNVIHDIKLPTSTIGRAFLVNNDDYPRILAGAKARLQNGRTTMRKAAAKARAALAAKTTQIAVPGPPPSVTLLNLITRITTLEERVAFIARDLGYDDK